MIRDLLCCVEALTLIHLLVSANLLLVFNIVCFISAGLPKVGHRIAMA